MRNQDFSCGKVMKGVGGGGVGRVVHMGSEDANFLGVWMPETTWIALDCIFVHFFYV